MQKFSFVERMVNNNGDGGVYGYDDSNHKLTIRQYMDKMNKALKNVK